MSAVLEPLEVSIRSMRWSDVAEIAAIERASYEFPWTERIFRDCLRVGYICRVLVHDHTLIGYTVMSAAAGEAHILNVCVRPNWQRRGLARSMLAHLLDDARDQGAKKVFLEVRPSNLRARRLYRAAGFKVVGRRKAYYQGRGGKEDALVLAFNLRPAGAA